jgi:hypothetical protein
LEEACISFTGLLIANNLGKFFLSLLLATAIIGGFVWYGTARGLFPWPSFFFETLLFLFFSSTLIFVSLYKANRPFFFLQLYLLVITLKLLLYGAYNLIIILLDRAGAMANVLFFVVTYFIFTVLETGFLYRKITGGDRP